MTQDPPPYTPLVLLIEDQEWTARSIESILSPNGYAVFKAYTGRQGLSVVRRLVPDLVLIDLQLPDMTGIEVLEELETISTITPSTPRVLISTGNVSQPDRMAALRAGAWGVLRPPFDSKELVLQLGIWIRAKRDSDQARDRGLVDPMTGLYNFSGLLKRIEELVADASRSERDISFVMLGPATERPPGEAEPDEPGLPDDVARLLSRTFTETSRLSDAVARVGEAEFVIIAPGTDRGGATRLAERLLDVARRNAELRAGIYSVRGSKGEPVGSLDLLTRVTTALRKAQSGENGGGIHAFEPN